MCRLHTSFFWLVAFAIYLVLPLEASAQNPNDFRVATYRINQVHEAKSFAEVIKECLNHEKCKMAADAGATYVGISPEVVGEAQSELNSQQMNGEEARYDFVPKSGYLFCTAYLSTTSVVPYSGSRATKLWLKAARTLIRIETWVPERNAWSGKTWYDGKLTIVSVIENKFGGYRDKPNNVAQNRICSLPQSFPKPGYSCQGSTCGSERF